MSAATVKGTVKGDQTVDYVLRAKAGQTQVVTMKTNHAANDFNVLPPGSENEAIYIGQIDGNAFTGTLPADGDDKVRVYLMCSAARRGETAGYTLEVGIMAGHPAAGANKDAIVPGTNFHATGNIPCATARGQPTGPCPFGVRRQGNRSGLVTVTKPDGRTRAIFFEKGEATGYDASQADPGAFAASREGDLTIVRIDQERYEIPDAVVSGG